MADQTENIRKVMTVLVNSQAGEREILEEKHGQVWDTKELQEDFKVKGFMSPFVVVERKSDGAVGSLMFQHHPRFYFGWTPD